MKNSPKTLRDVVRSIADATDAIEEIQRRALYGKTLERSFEQRVMLAAHEIDKGNPLKDFLSEEDTEIAVKTLADVDVVTGV